VASLYAYSNLSVPFVAPWGANTRFSTHPLPVLTLAHEKDAGAVQPTGRDPRPEVTASRVAPCESLAVKVAVTVCVPPLTTVTVPDTEDVAMTVFGVATGWVMPVFDELD